MARKTVKAKSDLTLDQVDALLGELAQCQKLENHIEGEMNEKIKFLKIEAQKELKVTHTRIKQLEKQIKSFVDARPELFKVKRTVEMNNGIVGLRKNPGALKLLPGFKWDAVVENAEDNRVMKRYVETTKKINKSGLLSDLRNKVISSKLAEKIGVSLSAKDEVVIEVKKTKIVNLQSAA